MKIYQNPDTSLSKKILQRPVHDAKNLEAIVGGVLQRVREEGDIALKNFTEKFDRVAITNFKVREEEIEAARNQVAPELKKAIQTAKSNISVFHQSQKSDPSRIETMSGIECWQKSVGIEKVGFYIPGGTAPLFSSVLMMAVPAQIAGCKEIILCTPPQKDGSINPVILYTANLCGVSQIFKVGGAQAVAAMAYGTETIPAVYKIYGPGNQYVTAAKQLVSQQGIAIDMPAGPSELMVVADHTAEASFVAADLLSQAEHGVDSQVVLVAFDLDFAKNVLAEIEIQLTKLPRQEIAKKALENSPILIIENRDIALNIVNQYAPEHLILALEEVEVFAEKVNNAGSVFMGNYTPESVGDYASGTNHTLPTNGYARSYSGLNLDAFVKKITFQKLSATGLQNIGKTVELMAEAEQLQAHKEAVSVRLREIMNNE